MSEAPSSVRKVTLTATGEVFVEPRRAVDAAVQRRFALLIFCDDDAQLAPLTVGPGIVVGRGLPSEVVVTDASVSQQHARFRLEQGQVWVTDLDSRNGTFLHGSPVADARLNPGDEVQIGRARIVLAATRVAEIPVEEPGFDVGDYVIKDPAMQRLYDDAARAARADIAVLVLGETGVGKESVVITVHRESARRDKPLIVVNCGAIAPGLLESTLFGHERGAFTGASHQAIGMFERASGGVLFLDEVGELNPSAQVALLRALETQRITRLGSQKEVQVDVRVVAATHCDLEGMVEEGSFRQDLYFRLSGVVLQVPPLRERPSEIEPLVRLFLARARSEWGVRATAIASDALEALARYHWPGNVRQLKHALERAALLAKAETIEARDLPSFIFASPSLPARPVAPVTIDLGLRQELQRYERSLIEGALQRAAGNREVAAKLLRVPIRTLYRRMRACRIGGDIKDET
jgi:DNA-binding NtrC family response regulator